MEKNAFIWRRQYSPEQMDKIDRAHNVREWFDNETLNLSRFSRCQLIDRDRWYNHVDSFDGVWEGKDVIFEPRIRPLYYDYAMKVYKQALKDAFNYYPGFDKHYFVDGPQVGERQLVFPDRLDEAAYCWIRNRCFELAKGDDITVTETFKVYPDDSGVLVEETDRKGNQIALRSGVIVEISLDLEKTNEDSFNKIFNKTIKKIRKAISKGKPYPVDTKPRKYEEYLLGLITEFSLPELVLLNWDQARKPLSEADKRLFDAIEHFDIDAIKAALDAGADPNAVQEDDRTPLVEVVSYVHADYVPINSDEDYQQALIDYPGPTADEINRVVDMLVAAGAVIDWAGYKEDPPIVEACLNGQAGVIEHLLDLGADPSIRSVESEEVCWGDAWEYAAFRCDPMIDHDDDSAWKVLIDRFKYPFGDIHKTN